MKSLSHAENAHHVLEITRPVYLPDEGFVLGNGDLSVCCFQKPGKIVFQFGKNDFWDLRLNLADNPRPAHINELRDAIERGLQIDGVTNEVTGISPEESLRFKELVSRVPAQMYNAPMPKSAAHLYIHYPADWIDCQWRQSLDIESGTLTISISHFEGVELLIQAVIHPECNRFSVNWEIKNYSPDKLYGGYFFGLPELPQVYATMFRPDAVDAGKFADQEMLEHGNNYFCFSKTYPTLPPAEVCNGQLVQKLPEGKTLYAALAGDGNFECSKGNFLRILPAMDALKGCFFAGISTDDADTAAGLAGSGNWEKDYRDTKLAAEKFWQKSSVHFDDGLLENCWYAAIHSKRAILRSGITPPGLFFPCTLQDYCQWKGDYHFNYNFQSMFLGDYETNHAETGDSYFEGVKYVMKLGEKISRDYYDIDGGCFVQLAGYPLYADDDYFGSLPLGRMAYMTGWVAAYFFRRWRLTMDRKFLQDTAYPALKKIAVFYAGFLTEDANGVFHAFPSNQGESEFSREGATDQPQVLMHAAFALRAAARAADELEIDRTDAERWKHISENLPLKRLADYPEFEAFDGVIDEPDSLPDFLEIGNRFHDWYFGQMPYKFSIRLRRNIWKADLWHNDLLKFLRRWLLPNGTLRAMSACTHYYHGQFTESLGIAGALTNMLMTSNPEGLIRLFPGIPAGQNAGFKTLRADGAVLVSAEKCGQEVKEVTLCFEKDSSCRLVNPWDCAKIDGDDRIFCDREIELHAAAGETIILQKYSMS